MFYFDHSFYMIQLTNELVVLKYRLICFRYKEADRNGKLFRLLKLCKYLDPRLAERDDEITAELVIQAVAAELGICEM